jgi:uncharacterized protein (TIGR00106 family)
MIVEFSIAPLDKGPSLSTYVAKVLDLVDKSGLKYKLNPMGTVIEGDWDEIMSLIKRCQDLLLEDSERVYTVIKIDARKSVPTDRLEHKVAVVEKLLGRKLRT